MCTSSIGAPLSNFPAYFSRFFLGYRKYPLRKCLSYGTLWFKLFGLEEMNGKKYFCVCVNKLAAKVSEFISK